MKNHFSLAMASTLAAMPLTAAAQQIDSKIHKLCIEAKDYAGCVNAMTGVRPSDGKIGNKCQAQFAYVRDGNCQRVSCKYSWWAAGSGNNNEIVAGKSTWRCPSQFRLGVILKGVLVLEEAAPVKHDPACPPREPVIGWNSSCEADADGRANEQPQ